MSSAWVCTTCTLVNPTHLTRCAACGIDSPKFVVPKNEPYPINLDTNQSAAAAAAAAASASASASPTSILMKKLSTLLDEKDDPDPLYAQLWSTLLSWASDSSGPLTDAQMEEVDYWHSKDAAPTHQRVVLTLFNRHVYRRMLETRFPYFFPKKEVTKEVTTDVKTDVTKTTDVKTDVTKVTKADEDKQMADMTKMTIRLGGLAMICTRKTSQQPGEGYLEYRQYRYLFRETMRTIRKEGHDISKLLEKSVQLITQLTWLIEYFATYFTE